jgi:hypothetical protein
VVHRSIAGIAKIMASAIGSHHHWFCDSTNITMVYLNIEHVAKLGDPNFFWVVFELKNENYCM